MNDKFFIKSSFITVCYGFIFSVILPLSAFIVLNKVTLEYSLSGSQTSQRFFESFTFYLWTILLMQTFFTIPIHLFLNILFFYMTKDLNAFLSYAFGFGLTVALIFMIQMIPAIFIASTKSLVLLSWISVSFFVLVASSGIVGLICVAYARRFHLRTAF